MTPNTHGRPFDGSPIAAHGCSAHAIQRLNLGLLLESNRRISLGGRSRLALYQATVGIPCDI